MSQNLSQFPPNAASEEFNRMIQKKARYELTKRINNSVCIVNSEIRKIEQEEESLFEDIKKAQTFVDLLESLEKNSDRPGIFTIFLLYLTNRMDKLIVEFSKTDAELQKIGEMTDKLDFTSTQQYSVTYKQREKDFRKNELDILLREMRTFSEHDFGSLTYRNLDEILIDKKIATNILTDNTVSAISSIEALNLDTVVLLGNSDNVRSGGMNFLVSSLHSILNYLSNIETIVNLLKSGDVDYQLDVPEEFGDLFANIKANIDILLIEIQNFVWENFDIETGLLKKDKDIIEVPELAERSEVIKNLKSLKELITYF